MAQQLSTNTFGVAKWIVSPTLSNGTHTTISAALAAASSGDTIFIRPGTYTENISLKANVNLTAFSVDGSTFNSGNSTNVIIVGKCSFSSAGNVAISGVQLRTNADYFLEVTGSATSNVQLNSCFLNVNDNTGINFTSSNASSSIAVNNCIGIVQTTGINYFTSSSAGTLTFEYCFLRNSPGLTTTPNTISAGQLNLWYCFVITPTTTSGTAGINAMYCRFINSTTNVTSLTVGGSGPSTINHCWLASGTASALSISSTLSVLSCVIDSTNANAVTGAGSISYTPLLFNASSSTINVNTQTVLSNGPRIQLGDGVLGAGGAQVMSGTGDPNATVTAPQGSLYLRRNGGVGTLFYVNSDGVTAWTAY